MKNFLYALRYLLKARTSNFTRIISLALGLGIGFLVFSFVNYQMTFDRFFPDRERIYQLWTNYDVEGLKGDYASMYAPVGPALAEEIPQVEYGTRIDTGYEDNFYYNDSPFKIRYHLVDTSFFSVLDFGAVSGDPRKIFADKNNIMISQSVARAVFGDKEPLGEILLYQNREPRTVAGVFKDPPANTHLGEFGMLGSLENLRGKFYMGWNGGDSFPTYIKLKKGTDIAQVEAQMNDFWERHGALEGMKKFRQTYFFVPITQSGSTGNNMRTLAYMLGVLGLLTVFVACMNYVLVSISTMVQRSKTIGMLKCNGATRKDIFSLFLWETLIILAVSLLAVVVLIYALRSPIESVTQYSVEQLFAWKRIWVPLAVSVFIFLTSGIIPARLFTSIPLTAAFKGAADSRRRWKQSLLFIQLASISFVVTFLLVIMLQFDNLNRGDFGYRYDNLAYASVRGTKIQLQRLQRELAMLPQTENAGLGGSLPLYQYDGQPAFDENTRELLFACRYDWAGPHYIPTMGMELVQGNNFRPDSSPEEVIVNEKYAELRNWDDSPVGRRIVDSDRSVPVRYTIVGVVKNFRMVAQEGRTDPVVIHNLNELLGPDSTSSEMYLFIRLREMSPENLAAVQKKLDVLLPSDHPDLIPYERTLAKALRQERKFRDTVIAVGIITFVIALIGLLGYLTDEIRRRSKEIAVRKVNGARMSDIIKMLARDLAFIVLPSVAAGIVLGYYTGDRWLESFEDRILLRWWIFFGAAFLISSLVYAIEIIRTWKIAGSNPVGMLKTE